MNLKECREKSKEILAEFVDCLGLDGKHYVSQTNCAMMWGKPKGIGVGEYIEPESRRLKEILEKSESDEKIKNKVFSTGLIIINEKYKADLTDPDLYITIMHEMIHANRNLLLYDSVRKNSNEDAYLYDGDVLKPVSNEYGFSYVDASQNVLKGNIDTSNNFYSNEKIEELDSIEFKTGKRGEHFDRQQMVDEALVELMSKLAYKIYYNKSRGKTIDIWMLLEETRNHFYGEDLSIICDIIIRHHDFELFYWMIDPVSYSMGDIHYDFFKDYTKNDSDLLEKLYGLSLDDYILPKSL